MDISLASNLGRHMVSDFNLTVQNRRKKRCGLQIEKSSFAGGDSVFRWALHPLRVIARRTFRHNIGGDPEGRSCDVAMLRERFLDEVDDDYDWHRYAARYHTKHESGRNWENCVVGLYYRKCSKVNR